MNRRDGGRSGHLAASLAVDLVDIAGALLALQVVRSIDARLAERHRRLHHASDEELDAIRARLTESPLTILLRRVLVLGEIRKTARDASSSAYLCSLRLPWAVADPLVIAHRSDQVR